MAKSNKTMGENLLRVGIVGCGAMGSIIAKKVDEEINGVELVALNDIRGERAQSLASSLTRAPKIIDLPVLIAAVDLVVEATSFEAAPKIALETLKKGRDILVLTVGGLFDRTDIFELAQEKRAKIYIPSGAIAGLDWLKAAALGGIREVTLITRKPAKNLEGAPYLKQTKVNLAALKDEVLLFEGPVEEAIKNFPANINIAATLALAASGVKVKVKILADPKLKRNTHEIKAEGEAGKLHLNVENFPSLLNPRSSQLAALSAVATLKEIASPFKIGT